MNSITTVFLVVFLSVFEIAVAQDGTLDEAFGVHGSVFPTFGGYMSDLNALKIDSDDKIITAGGVFSQSGYYQFALVRYKPDGSLDETFGVGGKVISDFPRTTFLKTMLMQSDGKLVVGAYNSEYSNGDYFRDSFLIRYNTDGTLDTGFGNDGIVIISSNTILNTISLVQQLDGKIVVYRYSNSGFQLIRYNPNGTLDSDFQTSDVLGNPYEGVLALQPDGKIILAGSIEVTNGSDNMIIRYNSNGTLDTTFGTNGEMRFNVDDNDQITSVKILPNGKMLFCGKSYHNESEYELSYTHTLLQVLPNGTFDPNFGKRGILILPIASRSLQLQSDGKIVLGGERAFVDSHGFSLNQIGLVRCLSNGSFDTAFGNGGLVLIPNDDLGGSSFGSLIGLQSDEKIVVGSVFCEAHFSCHPYTVLLRFNSEDVLINNEFQLPDNTFLVYPNPVKETLYFDFNSNQAETLSIDLYDNSGRLISNLLKNQNFPTGNNSQKLDLPLTLAEGVYFLTISNGTNTANIKIVK
ncbi:hypothetical protein FLJC2902T_27860 [Flavobacterium limnosediminis JC2902]|uniref:Secretion system C-terminal sorting domain-containing protein n=1 Tax=Flavobacterium limnosediminis JC2902 TaxID=1341181 RepID=V6SPH0_9FLAO|nr:T9SS type A sorting domain-containing protein [Flavobacterium limnosediminis]ESU26305.1 hypothetical protein FLJC2902T_27860 [Flavobacterium limnosediminis JC2902]